MNVYLIICIHEVTIFHILKNNQNKNAVKKYFCNRYILATCTQSTK